MIFQAIAIESSCNMAEVQGQPRQRPTSRFRRDFLPSNTRWRQWSVCNGALVPSNKPGGQGRFSQGMRKGSGIIPRQGKEIGTQKTEESKGVRGIRLYEGVRYEGEIL